MNKVMTTLEKATLCKTGNYKLTLKTTSKETEWGASGNQATYYLYIGAVNGQCPVSNGESREMDLDNYNIIEKPYTTDDGREMILKELERK